MKRLIIFVLICIPVLVFANLLIVDIEGNFEYTSIQAAVEAAVDGDDILVHPGTYYENVDFLGKQLELNSLFATTGERHFIKETIINGNGTGSCVRVLDSEIACPIIKGFTLTGGSGTEYGTTGIYYGGGIYLQDSDLDVSSCIIEENKSLSVGGGIALCHEDNLYVSDTIIRNNEVDWFGGGLFFYNGQSNIVFDSVNRCSIYNNYCPQGADIYCQHEGGNQVVYLDTITVADYAGYYVFQFVEHEPWFDMSGLTIDYQNIWLESVDADLYVSPNGADTNSGLNWGEPLRSITWAIQKIAVNPIEPRTIFLSEGTYSVSNTNEIMPFQVKGSTKIYGINNQSTIIDGEMESSFFYLNYGQNSFSIENLRFINARGDFYDIVTKHNTISIQSTYTGILEFKNIFFENNDTPHSILSISSQNSVDFDNISFISNGINNPPTALILRLWNNDIHHTAYLNNIKTLGNNTGKIILDGRRTSIPDFYVSNLVSSGNDIYNDGSTGWDNYYSLLGICNGQNCYLINSTLANNTSDMPSTSAAIQVGDFCNLEVINSIIYNNGTDYSINSINGYPGYEVNVHHSLIENGYNGINSSLPFIWDYGSNLDCNPMFSGNEDYPLSLQEDSPCVDAGTTEMPAGFTMPETDIAGNPRILGHGIDMGAYEYNPYSHPVGVDDEMGIADFEYYPNPVRLHDGRGAVMINYAGRLEDNDYRIGIYNVKGQKVWESELWRGLEGIRWDCCDANGLKVAAGVYFIRLSQDGEYLSQGKLTVIK